MGTGYRKATQFEKNAKKFGHPKFNDGDKVKTSLTGDEILTIDGNPFSNGFTWMYYFKENEMGAGQNYITKINQLDAKAVIT